MGFLNKFRHVICDMWQVSATETAAENYMTIPNSGTNFVFFVTRPFVLHLLLLLSLSNDHILSSWGSPCCFQLCCGTSVNWLNANGARAECNPAVPAHTSHSLFSPSWKQSGRGLRRCSVALHLPILLDLHQTIFFSSRRLPILTTDKVCNCPGGFHGAVKQE